MARARIRVAVWRRNYNGHQPRGAIGNLTLAEFAVSWRTRQQQLKQKELISTPGPTNQAAVLKLGAGQHDAETRDSSLLAPCCGYWPTQHDRAQERYKAETGISTLSYFQDTIILYADQDRPTQTLSPPANKDTTYTEKREIDKQPKGLSFDTDEEIDDHDERRGRKTTPPRHAHTPMDPSHAIILAVIIIAGGLWGGKLLYDYIQEQRIKAAFNETVAYIQQTMQQAEQGTGCAQTEMQRRIAVEEEAREQQRAEQFVQLQAKQT